MPNGVFKLTLGGLPVMTTFACIEKATFTSWFRGALVRNSTMYIDLNYPA